jgi:hypothetical protein
VNLRVFRIVYGFVNMTSVERLLASELADSLLSPGWYANWNSGTEATVVFPGKVFRYPRGDQAGRAEAQAHGRSVGVPEAQLDWTD